MDYYDYNIKALEESNSNLWKKFESLDEIKDDSNEVYSIDSKDGNKTIVISSDNKNYRLNSMYSPENEAKIWSEQFTFHYIYTTIAMFGLGSGYMVREVIKKMNKGSFLLIYEPSIDVFLHVIRNYDITDILANNRVILAVKGINGDDFHKYFQYVLKIENFDAQTFITHPQYDIIFTEDYRYFYQEIKDSNVHLIINMNTLVYFAEKNIENILLNLRHLKKGISIYEFAKAIPQNTPVVIVAAGPSVGENIEELKRIKGKAILIAVDRVLDFLLEKGVEPDITISIDGKKKLEHFTERDNVEIPMISYLESNHEIMDKHKGKKIICCNNDFIGELFKITGHTPPFIHTSASVATTAFTCCIKIGIKKIILVGQDLAYKGNSSHAGGVTENLGSTADEYVPGVNGELVRSRYDWKEFLVFLNDIIKLYPDVEVIDTKTEGAKIQGAKYISLKDVVDDLPNQNIDVNKIMKKFHGFTMKEYNEVNEYIKSVIPDIDTISEKAEEGIGYCKELLEDNSEKQKEDELGKKLLELNKYIGEFNVYSLMDELIMVKNRQNVNDVYYFSDDSTENSRLTYEKLIQLYNVILEVAKEIKSKLEKYINDIDNDHYFI